MSTEQYWRQLNKDYEENGLALALGAGVSVRCDLPDWRTLLEARALVLPLVVTETKGKNDSTKYLPTVILSPQLGAFLNQNARQVVVLHNSFAMPSTTSSPIMKTRVEISIQLSL